MLIVGYSLGSYILIIFDSETPDEYKATFGEFLRWSFIEEFHSWHYFVYSPTFWMIVFTIEGIMSHMATLASKSMTKKDYAEVVDTYDTYAGSNLI